MKPEIPKDELKSEILNRITTERICPHSKLFFRSRECFLWTLWLVTVVLGALAVALTLASLWLRQSELYELTHNSWFEAVSESVPYLWLLVFSMMIVAGIYNLRYTKQGYRYPLWQVFGSSLIFSLAGGALLHLAGAGLMVDEHLGQRMSLYESQAKQEEKLWQRPEEGRLVGALMQPAGFPVQFTDVTGTAWILNTTELSPVDLALLESGDKVRLLGEIRPTVPPEFYVCATFAWLYEKNMTMAEIAQTQKELRKRLHTHIEGLHRDAGERTVPSECLKRFKVKPMRPAHGF